MPRPTLKAHATKRSLDHAFEHGHWLTNRDLAVMADVSESTAQVAASAAGTMFARWVNGQRRCLGHCDLYVICDICGKEQQ